nr:hypothetical protein [Gleimia europaea]
MSNAPITQAHRERIEASRGFKVAAWLDEVEVETGNGPRPLSGVLARFKPRTAPLKRPPSSRLAPLPT